MSHQELERTLRALERRGERISQGVEREVWVFEFGGRKHRLHFYRKQRNSRAIAEFRGLTALQRAGVNAPRAIALMTGFRIGERLGDAVVVEYVEGFRRVGTVVREHALSDQPLVAHRQWAGGIGELVRKLGAGKLGHAALELDAFAVDGQGRLMIADGEPITRKGLLLDHVLRLGHTARRVATRADVLRAWQAFGIGAELPAENRFSKRAWRRIVRQSARGESNEFGGIAVGQWSGRFVKSTESPVRWAVASQVKFDREVWEASWPTLLDGVENDQLEILKRGDNGDVLRGEIIVHGRPLRVVVKRPRRKSVRQAVVDVFRPSRARRTWIKTWKMTVRDIPCEYPLLLMEKRTLGYVTDAVVVFGAIDGPTLAEIDLDAMTASARPTLFYRAGRTLRRIEALGFTHMDAKSTNWLVFESKSESPLPVLVDVDGVRHYNWAGAGIERLLRAMKHHSQYTPTDSLALCTGYAPRATIGAGIGAGIGIEPE